MLLGQVYFTIQYLSTFRCSFILSPSFRGSLSFLYLLYSSSSSSSSFSSSSSSFTFFFHPNTLLPHPTLFLCCWSIRHHPLKSNLRQFVSTPNLVFLPFLPFLLPPSPPVEPTLEMIKHHYPHFLYITNQTTKEINKNLHLLSKWRTMLVLSKGNEWMNEIRGKQYSIWTRKGEKGEAEARKWNLNSATWF